MLAILLLLIAVQVPVQAFSVTEQLGKLKDFALENPKTALYTAGGVFLIGSLIALICAENADFERNRESLRILQEHFAQKKKAEQDRIDALDLEQFIAECIAARIAEVQKRLQKAKYTEIIEVHTDLLEKPLSNEERKALKNKLRFLCFEHGNQFDSNYWYQYRELNDALDMIKHRVSIDPQAQTVLAVYAGQIENLQNEMHKISSIFKDQAQKEADKKARNTPPEPKVVIAPHTPYYEYNHNCNQITPVVQPASASQEKSKTPQPAQPQLVVEQPVIEKSKEVKTSVKTPKVTYDDQTYDILNPYHTLIGD